MTKGEPQLRQMWREMKLGLGRLWALPWPWKVGIVAIVGLIIFLAIPQGDSQGGSSTRSRSPSRQEMYNAFLVQARRDVRHDPDLNCDPDYQQLVIDQVRSATGGQKALIQLAMGDACIEIGEWWRASYSGYHEGFPTH